MPQFSIILPCFNSGATLPQTLASLRAQSLTDWEAICVDDGSTDDTLHIIASAAEADPRIRGLRNSGKGPSAARNLGAQQAKADLIAFCDADDLWLPGKLAQLAQCFADPQVDGAFGQIGFFNTTPKDAQVFSSVPQGALTIQQLLGENPVCTMSNLSLRRCCFLHSGGFDLAMIHNEDLEFLIRLVGFGAQIMGLPQLQTYYRTSVGGLSTDLGAMLAGRARAIETAARFGIQPSAQSHAIHHRYLARRALRLGAARTEALRHALIGLRQSPGGFFSPRRRGVLTLAGAVAALILPRATRQSLFS
ncbi:glycosyltransferase family 2 protein [Pseudorhodobacter sp. E13]|uniref:glycosyltransferase family 2 protein n=1 Tax=Pseudorhodobacter sp. E13 TaxID=2487931 RepID=UPI000F8C8DEE|nr:glycosyltransferase family 2 protein [Pseudorhodobacter sp. E13]RUS60787.1 glycosyltransferase family 2 protein [Pseudorhodobacter sp. E13]